MALKVVFDHIWSIVTFTLDLFISQSIVVFVPNCTKV